MCKDLLDSLREKAKTLDQKLADVNAQIEAREKALNDTGIGVEAEIELVGLRGSVTFLRDEGGLEEGCKCVSFGFGKKTGKWGLYVQGVTHAWQETTECRLGDITECRLGDIVEEDPAIPLKSAPREVRIEAMQLFRDLLETIESSADHMIAEADRCASS